MMIGKQSNRIFLSPAANETLEVDEERDPDIPIPKAPAVKEVLY